MKPLLLLLWACGLCGCGAAQARAEEPPQLLGSAEYLSVARSLASCGHALEASLFYEAALSAGADPVVVLKELSLAEIHAGRLRDARRRLDQLLTLRPMDEDLRQLRTTLDGLLRPGRSELSGQDP
ncbi:MAG: hypothetical protein MUC50_02120 [Myxococcota bacterium]|jgi:hypothetical protein|nr:hypothetical protein [Myxococcota bacterium]